MIEPLIKKGISAFYAGYVDDILVLIKPENIDFVLTLLNNFDRNLNFICDNFDNNKVHFLDISILFNSETTINHKLTFTGQHCHLNSFVPWKFKISWARCLFNGFSRICSNGMLFKQQVNNIKTYLSWNNFLSFLYNSRIHKCNIYSKFNRSVESKLESSEI